MQFTAESYAADVISGTIPACKQIISACKRHQKDTENGHERGLYFDEDAAKVAIAFFGLLKHWKGEWAGQPIELEPWQQFIIWNLFGWRRADGTRRFRTAYIEVPRKNGKTTVAAGAGIYLAFVDGEPGAEVYTAATKRDQARIAHNDATKMVKASPQLKKIITPYKDNLHNKEDGSKFEPLGRDSNSMDGLNVHGAICDEVHAWNDRMMWDLLDTATGSRRQPLMFAITTAGFDRQSLCYQLHDYAEKVAYGVIDDDSFFGMIYTIDEGDDWENEDNWYKANPNLGISKKLDDMRRLAARAKEMPAALNSFLRLHLNVWTQSSERWISPEHWAACDIAPIDEKYLAGRDCWAAVDLSSRGDITAVVYVFPGEKYSDITARFFIPEFGMRQRAKRDRVPYETWERQGHITATPGDRIDHDYILAQIQQDMTVFNVREIAFDPWNASHVTTKLLEQGANVIEFRQGYVSMNPAMGSLDAALSTKKINHGGNPVLGWMADNTVAAFDPAGNMKPDKSKSSEKIDGVVALIMAQYRATLANGITDSVYSNRGIRSL